MLSVRCGPSPRLLSGMLVTAAKSTCARHGAAMLLHMPALQPEFVLEFEEEPIPMEQVREIADTEATPLSLRQMQAFTESSKFRVVSAQFLHKELQLRFARAIMELSDLPAGLSEMAPIRQAIGVYRHDLHLLGSMRPPSCLSEDRVFTETLRREKLRGSNLVPLICYGLQQLKAANPDDPTLQMESVQEDIKDRLDQFFLGRIGIRMLIGQHVESLEHPGGRVRLLTAEDVVRGACERARRLCVQYCGAAPPVHIRAAPNAHEPFVYVESHLHHMVFELVKNSMRATVEHHRARARRPRRQATRVERVMNPDSRSLGFYIPSVHDVSGVRIYPDSSEFSAELPPVEIVICQGSEDLTVRVSDEGGGVPRSRWSKLWHYDYTTSPLCPPIDLENYPTYREHFSGGGYGLPMARLFARYFGGDVVFSSQEGVGSTGFVHAHRLGTNMEQVPLKREPTDWELQHLECA